MRREEGKKEKKGCRARSLLQKVRWVRLPGSAGCANDPSPTIPSCLTLLVLMLLVLVLKAALGQASVGHGGRAPPASGGPFRK